MASNRNDFTFRSELFGAFPKVIRPHAGFKAQIDRKYKMQINLYKYKADYSIDGTPYAYTFYPENEKF